MPDTLKRDLVYAVRTLKSRPLATGVAALCLALGIAAVTVIFSLVRTVVLDPLPFEDPEELSFVWLRYDGRDQDELEMSGHEAREIQERQRAFASAAAMIPWYYNVTTGEEPERVVGGRVNRELFSTLGVTPAHGRFWSAEEEAALAPVIVLSHDFWQQRFGGDEGVLGRTVSLEDAPYTVVGILPEDFRIPLLGAALWVPLHLDPASPIPRSVRGVFLITRDADGVSAQQTQADLDSIAATWMGEHPDLYPADSGFGLYPVRVQDQLVGDVRPAILALAVVVLVVLLIACGNVAGLLLAQAAGRDREVALRVVLGARRRQLVHQLLTESVLLGLVGGAAGLILAAVGLRWVSSLELDNIPRLEDVGLDWPVLLFALGVSLLTGVLFGLIPALKTSRPELQGMLKEGSKSTASGSRKTFKGALVVAEVALALMVLMVAGLTIRSLGHLERVDPGFETDHLLTFEVVPSRARYPAPPQRTAFFERLQSRLEEIPGVESVGMLSNLPLGTVDLRGELEVEGRPVDERDQILTGYRMVGGDVFETLGIPLRQGRWFDSRDAADSRPVAVVDEKLAQRLWPGQDPLGRRVRLVESFSDQWWTVVGVVGHIRQQRMTGEEQDQVYVPLTQYPPPYTAVLVRGRGEPQSWIRDVRQAVRSVDPLQPVGSFRTGEELLQGELARPRFNRLLFGFFGITALLLASLGVYGLLAQTVRERRREIGLRMALGARMSTVLRQIVGEGLVLGAVGLVLGLALTFAAVKVLEGWFGELAVGIRVFDPLALGGAVAAVLLWVVLASYLPARRAARVDPAVVLGRE